MLGGEAATELPGSTEPGWEELRELSEGSPSQAGGAVAAEEGEPRGPAVGAFEIGTVPPADHYYLDAPAPTGKSSKKLLRRAASEWKQLHEGLPEQITAQVFDERMDLLRVVIEGPPDTPYQHAIFVFDIHLQTGYPDVPPRVTYWAWGKRINPNLYSNGKVCLSLLGTWAGPSWEPQVSTLLQVLVSIQAMILIDTPYCNEPGQQGDAGTQKSLDYNAQVQADVVHSMTMMANKPPIGLEQIVSDFIAREGSSLVRMARELPNRFITEELLVALDAALKHPLGEPVTGKMSDSDPGRMETPSWLKLAEAPQGEDAERGSGAYAAGINADEEKESCAFVCLGVSCSLVVLLLIFGALHFALQFSLWCVGEIFGSSCECSYETQLHSQRGPLFPSEALVAATHAESKEQCCTICQTVPNCKTSMFLEEQNTVALLGWLNGTAWQDGVAEAGLGTFTDGPASNRVSCFLTDRTDAYSWLKPVKVPKVAANTTWKTVATMCTPVLTSGKDAAYEWSTAFTSLLPLGLRIIALCASMLSAAPGVQGIVLAARACGLDRLGAKVASTAKLGGHVAGPSESLTESLSGGEEELERGSSGNGLPRDTAQTAENADKPRSLVQESIAAAGVTTVPARVDGRALVDGAYVARRAVAAVEVAEAATESADEAAAKAEWGALTGSGFGQLGYMGMEYSRPQSTWDAARLGLGLTVWEGKALSIERMLLWYWVQPVAFFWVLGRSYCGLSPALQWESVIVALREITFMLATIVAALPCSCPGFLLLDFRLVRPSQWERHRTYHQRLPPADTQRNGAVVATISSTDSDLAAAEGGVDGAVPLGTDHERTSDDTSVCVNTDEPRRRPKSGRRDPLSQLVRAAIYVLAPHHFVTLCLIRRFGVLWVIVVLLHFLADLHSLNALWLLLGEPRPMGAIAVAFSMAAPWIFAWTVVVAWRYVDVTREKIAERPAAARVCQGVSGCVMVLAAAAILALCLSAVLVFGGALSPGDEVCYSAQRGDECVATGQTLGDGSHLPERYGHTCVGSACAAQPQLGSLFSEVACSTAAPDGYALDVKTGRCVPP